jgi:hypothetical protein
MRVIRTGTTAASTRSLNDAFRRHRLHMNDAESGGGREQCQASCLGTAII